MKPTVSSIDIVWSHEGTDHCTWRIEPGAETVPTFIVGEELRIQGHSVPGHKPVIREIDHYIMHSPHSTTHRWETTVKVEWEPVKVESSSGFIDMREYMLGSRRTDDPLSVNVG